MFSRAQKWEEPGPQLNVSLRAMRTRTADSKVTATVTAAVMF